MSHLYLATAFLAEHPEASSLAADLTRWHDRMVAHLRRYGTQPPADCCQEAECPRQDAPELWSSARRVLGVHAERLTFLRTQATGGVS